MQRIGFQSGLNELLRHRVDSARTMIYQCTTAWRTSGNTCSRPLIKTRDTGTHTRAATTGRSWSSSQRLPEASAGRIERHGRDDRPSGLDVARLEFHCDACYRQVVGVRNVRDREANGWLYILLRPPEFQLLHRSLHECENWRAIEQALLLPCTHRVHRKATRA
jgi:hypothetical protein